MKTLLPAPPHYYRADQVMIVFNQSVKLFTLLHNGQHSAHVYIGIITFKKKPKLVVLLSLKAVDTLVI